jgi:dolichol-phosphate mannosyltransferase
MLTTVIPVFNEVESLPALYQELAAVAQLAGLRMEMIFVDDGSTDGSWNQIARLAAQDPRVRGIRFRRNFGKAAALSAGFNAARGDRIVTLDADLQDDPREIPNFLDKMDLGFDVVSGWKQIRHDPWHKVLPSRVFNWMVSALTGVHLHDHNCGMKSYRREIFREVRLYGELHRFVPVLAHARGFNVGEHVVRHRPRKFGQSKYGLHRFIKGFLDLLTVKFLTGFGQRPQHILGTLGLLCFLIGGGCLTYLSIYWLRTQLSADTTLPPLHQRPLVIYAVGALLLGGQLMSIGFLAELITAYQGRDSDTYSIAEETAVAAAQPPAGLDDESAIELPAAETHAQGATERPSV